MVTQLEFHQGIAVLALKALKEHTTIGDYELMVTIDILEPTVSLLLKLGAPYQLTWKDLHDQLMQLKILRAQRNLI
jgi:hypothetical protein